MQCVECLVSLEKRPCISVYGESYCFGCAKRTVKDLEQSALQQFQRQMEVYNETNSALRSEHQQWCVRRKYALEAHKGIGALFATGCVFAYFGQILFSVLGGFFAFFIGCFVFNFFWEKRQAQLDAAFRLKYPEPVGPKLEPPIHPEPITDFELDDSRFTESTTSRNYRAIILARDNYTCQTCQEHKREEDLEVHHIQTQANGGPDHPTNLITLCLHCHDRETWFDHTRKFPTTIRRRRRR